MTKLRSDIINVMVKRGWSPHWTHRSAYLFLEAAELTEAVRGKGGDTLDESADVLITLLALSPHTLEQIVTKAEEKIAWLVETQHYDGEEYEESRPVG